MDTITTEAVTRTLHRLVDPIHLVTYICDEPTEALMSLGYRNFWDCYFAGRGAPLGYAPAAVVHAVFYNFADGEVARHIPFVWEKATPEEALAARQHGSVAALRRLLGELAESPGLARAADLATRAGVSAPTCGRPLYAGLRALPIPDQPVARLWHAATLLREHRGDGHNAVLLGAGIGGTEAHVLHALYDGMPAGEFGRVAHLPGGQLAAVIDGMRNRNLIDSSGWLSEAGRETKDRIEALTDDLAAPAYECLDSSELDELVTELGPISARLDAAGVH